jgi:hypothetical protein
MSLFLFLFALSLAPLFSWASFLRLVPLFRVIFLVVVLDLILFVFLFFVVLS